MIRKIIKSRFFPALFNIVISILAIIAVLHLTSCGKENNNSEKKKFTKEKSRIAKENLESKAKLTDEDRIVIIKDLMKISEQNKDKIEIDKKKLGIE